MQLLAIAPESEDILYHFSCTSLCMLVECPVLHTGKQHPNCLLAWFIKLQWPLDHVTTVYIVAPTVGTLDLLGSHRGTMLLRP